MNLFAYFIFIFSSLECFSKKAMSNLTLSTTVFLNLSRMSTWKLFENIYQKWWLSDDKCAIVLYSLGTKSINKWINYHSSTTKFMIQVINYSFINPCGIQLNCLLEYENFKPYLLSGPCIGLTFERNIILLHVYVLCPIYIYQTLDPNNPDETYVAFISKTSLVWICLWLKYEYLLTKIPRL